MKIAVMNFSGNVGKTTVCVNLLKPRMPGAPLYSIESLNSDAADDGFDVEKMKGKKYGELIDQLMVQESAIVDVGSSNAEDFMKLMQQYAGSHEEFDYFVVPTEKARKQQRDTVNTLRALSSIGVPKAKIRVLFNKVEDEAIEDDFAAIFGLAELEKSFTIRHNAVIYANEVFEKLKSANKSLSDVMDDPTDYRAQLREATTDDDREICTRMIGIKRLGVTATQNLDDAFKALFSSK